MRYPDGGGLSAKGRARREAVRLQHDRLIPYSHFNGLRTRFVFADE